MTEIRLIAWDVETHLQRSSCIVCTRYIQNSLCGGWSLTATTWDHHLAVCPPPRPPCCYMRPCARSVVMSRSSCVTPVEWTWHKYTRTGVSTWYYYQFAVTVTSRLLYLTYRAGVQSVRQKYVLLTRRIRRLWTFLCSVSLNIDLPILTTTIALSKAPVVYLFIYLFILLVYLLFFRFKHLI